MSVRTLSDDHSGEADRCLAAPRLSSEQLRNKSLCGIAPLPRGVLPSIQNEIGGEKRPWKMEIISATMWGMVMDAERDPSPEGVEREFQSLMDRVRAGSEEACWELIDLYGHHILRAVRRMMDDKLRPRFDSIDFVQSVWAVLFTSRTRLDGFDNPERFISFLYAVARNKVGMERRRRFQTRKHDVERERQLIQCMEEAPESMIQQTSTPSQIAVARERWELLTANQPEHYRQILALRYAGATFAEIAAELGMNERSVRKVIDKLQSENRLQE